MAGTAAPPPECVIPILVDSHLRAYPRREAVGERLAAGTSVELLGATASSRTRAVLTRVRVVATGAAGFLFVDRATLRACQRAREDPARDVRVREEHAVLVDGVEETWQLRWRRVPERVCDDAAVDQGCDCWPFRAGEQGPLELVRIRGGRVIDRLDRWPYQEDAGSAPESWGPDLALRRWILPPDAPEGRSPPNYLERQVEAAAMLLADIDHDGRATEFAVVSTGGAGVCGHYGAAFVVGISREEPTLHVFRRADDPRRVAWLRDVRDWLAVAAESPRVVLTWPCGDHGQDGGSDAVRVSAERGRFAFVEGYFPADEQCRRTGPFVPGAWPEPEN